MDAAHRRMCDLCGCNMRWHVDAGGCLLCDTRHPQHESHTIEQTNVQADSPDSSVTH